MRELIFSEQTRKRIYQTAFMVYLAELILFNSVYGKMDQLQQIFAMVRVAAYFFVCSKLFLDFLARSFSLKEIGVVGLISMFLLWTTLHTGNKAILIYWAFIVGAHDVELKKLIKWSCTVHVLCLLFVIASSYAGIIENRLYDSSKRKRESLGFQFATESSNYFFYTILMWIYLRKEKITWKELAGLAAFAAFLFHKTDTKSAFAFSCAALVFSIVLKEIPWFRTYHKGYIAAAVCCVPLLAYSIFCLTVKYSTRIHWMTELNKLVSSRLSLGKKGFRQYGVPLWGQRIEWVGGTAGYEKSGKIYNYVDSSYIQILLNLGLVFLLLLIVLFIILGLKTAIKKDSYLLLVMILFAMHSTFDPQIIWMEFNTFVMLYSYFYQKGERSPYLERLKKDLWRHRTLAGICMAVLALIFAKGGIRKAEESQARAQMLQQKAETYEANMAGYDSQTESVEEVLQLAGQQAEALRGYVDQSPYMKLNGDAINTYVLRYQVETEGNLGNILNSLIFYINEGGLQSAVAEVYKDPSIKYWREMVSCSTNENILSVILNHYSEEEGQKLMALIQEKLLAYTAAAGAVQGTFTLTETENTFYVRNDSGITANQVNHRTNLENYGNNQEDLKKRIEGIQDNKESYMEKNQPVTVKPASGKTALMVQYGGVGLAMGLIIVCLLLMTGYLLWDRGDGETGQTEVQGSRA